MELAVGTKLTFGGKTYIVSDEHQACTYCDLNQGKCLANGHRDITGLCSLIHRTDNKNVVFKEVKEMETKDINIAKILANKPKDTKLYSPMCGDCTFVRINSIGIDTYTSKGQYVSFLEDGKYYPNGEVMLFPSKEMRDWSKFAWKKGDVLESKDYKKEVIFDSFVTSDYTCFKGKHFLDCNDESRHKYKEEIQLFTASYNIEDKDAAQCYINTIEERLVSKLNMKTLEIEPIKPKYEFKPFDKVLVRDRFNDTWDVNFFSHIDKEGSYWCVGACWNYCIPYNEETAKLIGTTKSLEDLK